ncbi:DUF2325 domain-containing protein [Bacillus paranthracis]|uniref:DUF2325 domain-containing protein n=1 Tax=Bacillus cereus TaxID=1396 RepID=A0A2B0MQL9_BACCE|nr:MULTISPECIES: DUF2325 domain-containing protein [Bacillus]KXI53134.1 hypothetical protein ACS45_08820 [Bacillus cereus]KAB7634868.1 DUF2325 domain-containing protein [Bacillus sp. B4-WWTP-NA-D-NA-NA]MCU5096016.1 DUF2325 domain-containing protein [Bacillus wiedmannii]MCZ7523356.1 DUF2325 domain-containing protein [Bacillus pacificus]MDA1574732.1 DUF2325 domain-containing protein [Bacillus cereus group sp. TH242-3LC]
MKKVAIIGGDNKQGYLKKCKEKNLELLFHDGRIKRKGSKEFYEKLIKEVNCVILILNAVSHKTMYEVREVAKKFDIPIIYHKTKGVNSTIRKIHDKVAFN